jgi:hypothetical protein
MLSRAPVRRRARPPNAPLYREVIVRARLAALDRNRIDTLTTCRVAPDRETGPASLHLSRGVREDLCPPPGLPVLLDGILAAPASP